MLHENIESENKMTQSFTVFFNVFIWHTGLKKQLGNVTVQYTLQNFKSIKMKGF